MSDNGNSENSNVVFIGVDGGGSKTQVVVIKKSTTHSLVSKAEDIQVVANTISGSTNVNNVGEEKAKKELMKAIDEAIQQISIENYSIGAIGLGMSGVDRESDKQRMRGWLSEHPIISKVKVVEIFNDAVAALCSGTLGKIEKGKSMVLISGTGVICVGFSEKEEWIRAGGWGPLLGDEGSGYAIGSAILKHALHQHDGVTSKFTSGEEIGSSSPKSVLMESVKQSLGLKTPDELIPFVYGDNFEWGKVAALAPLCFECADKGDTLARMIVQEQSNALHRYVECIAQRMHKEFTLVFAGSVLTHENSIMASVVEEKLKKSYPGCSIVRHPVVVPAVGSALYASSKV